MRPVTMHYITTRADHARTRTLCGLTLVTDVQDAARIVSRPTGWITCPLCEAAALLDGYPQTDDERRPHEWQPTIYDLLAETN